MSSEATAAGPGSRWAGVAGDAGTYAARFAALGAEGHGEADACERLVAAPARVLDAGCGTGRVAIRLAARGYDVVGVDLDPAMLAVARAAAPRIAWYEADLGDVTAELVGGAFDLVVAAGNVLPLVVPGTEPAVLAALAGLLGPDGLLLAGFGLDAAHLPIAAAPWTLADYDGFCAAAGLLPVQRWSTWDGDPYEDGGGYVVAQHRRAASPG